MKYIICLTFALLFMLPVRAAEERNLLEKAATESQIRQYLQLDRKWVPYPVYQNRQGWDQLMGDQKDRIIKTGEKYLDYDWVVVKASQYMEFEKSGDRDIMQNPNNKNTNAFANLLLAELAEGKGRFMTDIVNGVFYFCEMTSWAESAHLAAYQKTHRALPDYREQILELHQGGKAQMLAWTYYFLHDSFDKIDPVISQRLRYELQRRELDPYMSRNDFWWMALGNRKNQMVNNWNPWCNANALLCFMLLEDNPDVLAKAVYKTMRSVDKFLNYVKSDGACEEGPSYWGHASGKLLDYLSELSLITGGKVSLFQNPMVKAMGEYIVRSYIGDGWVVNFADASARSEGEPSLIYRYGQAVNSPTMKTMAAYFYQQTGKVSLSGLDVYRSLETLRVLPALKAETAQFKPFDFTWYPETEFCYMRQGSSFLACKGGYNDESHNHNDVGTCILFFDNIPVLVDAGVGTYTRQTFSSERYKIWTMQSDYHNLPMINGVSQRYGGKYKSRDARANSKQRLFSLDISQAYPAEAAVDKWVRTYQLKNNRLLINDRFTLREAKAPNQINFLVCGQVDTSVPGSVTITIKGQKNTLKYDAKAFDASTQTVSLTDPRLSNVWGPELTRISLKARNLVTTGAYKFEVVKNK